MDFKTAVITCLQKYATFSGRARLSEYWWFYLAQILAILVGSVLHEMIGGVVVLAILLPAISSGVRRLHDMGKSGWWMLIGLIPIVGFFIMIYFLTRPSQPETNQWGEPPAQLPA